MYPKFVYNEKLWCDIIYFRAKNGSFETLVHSFLKTTFKKKKFLNDNVSLKKCNKNQSIFFLFPINRLHSATQMRSIRTAFGKVLISMTSFRMRSSNVRRLRKRNVTPHKIPSLTLTRYIPSFYQL